MKQKSVLGFGIKQSFVALSLRIMPYIFFKMTSSFFKTQVFNSFQSPSGIYNPINTATKCLLRKKNNFRINNCYNSKNSVYE